MGELLAHQKELAGEMGGHSSEQNDWNDDHVEKEERDRRDEHLGRDEQAGGTRVRTKDGAQGSNQNSAHQTRKQGKGAQGGLEGMPSARGGAAGARGRDGFESVMPSAARTAASAAAKPALSLSGENPVAPPPPSRMSGGAMHVLNSAKEPGVYFRAQERDGGHEEDEDPELAEAVEEAIRLLFGVRGIHHVGPGLNEANEPVVLISVSRGFSEASMRAVPERVHRFRTLVALPYELLPLRRDV